MKGTHLSAVAIAAAILLAGCSGWSAYRHGNDMMEAGNFDGAVFYYAQAVGHDPDKDKYRAALADARARSADAHVDQARVELNARDLAAARRHVSTALQRAPEHRSAKALAAEIDVAIARAEATRAKARGLADAGQFEQAVATMRRALEIHRTLPEGQSDLHTLNTRAAEHFVVQANAALDRDDRPAAAGFANKATEYVADAPAARQVLAAVRDRDQADALVADARGEIAAGNPDAALPRLAEARNLWPARPGIDALIHDTKQTICDRHLAAGQAFAGAGDHAAAIRAFATSRGMLPGYGRVDELMAGSRTALARSHRAAGQAAEQAGRVGLAMVHYLIADEHVPGTSPAGAIDRLAGQVRQRVQFGVQVDGDGEIRDALADRLAAGADSAVTIGRPGAFGLRVNVALADTDVHDATAVRYGQSRYQDGVRLVPNPDYDSAVDALRYAHGRVDKYRGQVRELEAELRALQSREPRHHMEGDQDAEAQAEAEAQAQAEAEAEAKAAEEAKRKEEEAQRRREAEERQRDREQRERRGREQRERSEREAGEERERRSREDRERGEREQRERRDREEQERREGEQRRDDEERERRGREERRSRDDQEQERSDREQRQRRDDEDRQRREREEREREERGRKDREQRERHEREEQDRRDREQRERHEREERERREREEHERHERDRRERHEAEERRRRAEAERQRRIEEYRRQVRTVRSSLDGKRSDLANAIRSIEQARDRLRWTPEHLEEPVFVTWQFPIHRVTRTARVTLRLSAADQNTNAEALPARLVAGTSSASDETVTPDPAHHVAGDPLQLPDGRPLIDAACGRAVAAAAAVARGLIAARGEAALAAGADAVKAGRRDDAVEHYVDYLFMYSAGNGQNRTVFDALADNVDYADDLVKLAPAMQARCGLNW